ncbi:hypothetical protein N7481_002831 [Penicillium waksmanii]|uniref:uncharacterized protein n=1 Tax=Penicillium waksmanii TaxID=69791 RepID=UPI002548BCEF|nr:uncharacterized protein N7481_002831 [Penicillium waksmanii]KAJ5995854.1 hypothetical protein N7481_002831 [Penicillium waksmanii]
MERELRLKGLEAAVNENRDTLNQINDERGDRSFQGRNPINEAYSPISSHESCTRGNLSCGVPIDLATHGQHLQRDITVLDMIQIQNSCSDISEDLPPLPSDARARELVDTVYFYTQARYCIIDWVQLREWHRDRESIAYATTSDPVDLQIGSFFIWIIYAIGACLVPISESSTEAYFYRARAYIPIVMSAQNMDMVQALLCLVQYSFRAQNDSPLWDLVGIALRLCVKLKYHRRIGRPYNPRSLSAYKMELQKRFFWCAYCFDRLVSMLAKLPFGIRDVDIDVELPVDINDTCIDEEAIRSLQERQINENTTTMKGITTVGLSNQMHKLPSSHADDE